VDVEVLRVVGPLGAPDLDRRHELGVLRSAPLAAAQG
jgi:hypothetical protein